MCISVGKFSSGFVENDSWFGMDAKNSGKVYASSMGPGVTIGEGTTIRNSVILEGSEIGSNCSLDGCLIGAGVRIPSETTLVGEIINHG